jgi:hypothetical protein
MSVEPNKPIDADDLFWIRHGYKDQEGRVIDDEHQQTLFGVDLYFGPPRGRRRHRETGPTLFDVE